MLGIKNLISGGELSRRSLLYRFVSFFHNLITVEAIEDSCRLRALLIGAIGKAILVGVLIVGLVAFLGIAVWAMIDAGLSGLLIIAGVMVCCLIIYQITIWISEIYERYPWTRTVLKGLGLLLAAIVASVAASAVIIIIAMMCDLGLFIAYLLVPTLVTLEPIIADIVAEMFTHILVGLIFFTVFGVLVYEIGYVIAAAIPVIRGIKEQVTKSTTYKWIKGRICFKVTITD